MTTVLRVYDSIPNNLKKGHALGRSNNNLETDTIKDLL
jgi:hypothetical protein